MEDMTRWAGMLSEEGQLLRETLIAMFARHKIINFGYLIPFASCLPDKIDSKELHKLYTSGLAAYIFADIGHRIFYEQNLDANSLHRQRILLLIKLYLHHDRQLDSRSFNPSDRSKLMEGFDKLVSMAPESKDILYSALQAELISACNQYSSSHTLQEYKDRAERKGGMMTVAIAKLMDLPSEQLDDFYELGAIIQHFDDILDHNEDIEAGIFTYANTLAIRSGDIEPLIKECWKRTNKLNKRLNFYKITLIQIINLACMNSDYCSATIKNLVNPYTYLLFDNTDEMIDKIGEWLEIQNPSAD